MANSEEMMTRGFHHIVSKDIYKPFYNRFLNFHTKYINDRFCELGFESTEINNRYCVNTSNSTKSTNRYYFNTKFSTLIHFKEDNELDLTKEDMPEEIKESPFYKVYHNEIWEVTSALPETEKYIEVIN